jgi:periplasmic protein CpxP/Spy
MDATTKNKSLVSIIIFLLITNIVMLVFFLVLNKPAQKNIRERDAGGMSVMLQKEVGFTKEQLDAYQDLRKQHSDTIHMLFDKLRRSKTDFYGLLYDPKVLDSALQNASAAIASNQEVLDLHMFNHFKMVRNICTADQLARFDTSIKKVVMRMNARPGREAHEGDK